MIKIMNIKKYRFPRKHWKCPVYKSKIVGTYAYGLQTHNEEQERKIKEGRVIPGGCVIDHGQPVLGCKFCGTDYYRLTDEEYLPWMIEQDKNKLAAESGKPKK